MELIKPLLDSWVILNYAKVIVWAAVVVIGSIGPFFIGGNVDGDQYLTLLGKESYPAFCAVRNVSELFFRQDGSPPQWVLSVR